MSLWNNGTYIDYIYYTIANVETSQTAEGYTSAVNTPYVALGILQWSHTRAYSLCCRMRDNGDGYSNLNSTLRSELDQNNNNLWSTRVINSTEASSLSTFISTNTNVLIQDTQAREDIAGYIETLITRTSNVAIPEANEKQIIFICAMYHQAPSYTNTVLKSVGGNATLTQIYNACMNHSWLGKFKTRYDAVLALANDWAGTMPYDFPPSGNYESDDTPKQDTGDDTNDTSEEEEETADEFKNRTTVYVKDKMLTIYNDQYPTGMVFTETYNKTYTAGTTNNSGISDNDQEDTPATSEPEPTPTPEPSDGFIWMVPNHTTITSYYGERWGTFHHGIDISDGSITGANIVASQGGTCQYVMTPAQTGSGFGGYGNIVFINHNNGYWTLYAHCQDVLVSQGQTVAQGEVIATVGNTGNSTGPHLHFEIRTNDNLVNKTTVDPLTLVSPN